MNGDRERAALLAIGDLVAQMQRDLEMMSLALACVSCEVEDALRSEDPGLFIVGDPLSVEELIVLVRSVADDDPLWGGR